MISVLRLHPPTWNPWCKALFRSFRLYIAVWRICSKNMFLCGTYFWQASDSGFDKERQFEHTIFFPFFKAVLQQKCNMPHL